MNHGEQTVRRKRTTRARRTGPKRPGSRAKINRAAELPAPAEKPVPVKSAKEETSAFLDERKIYEPIKIIDSPQMAYLICLLGGLTAIIMAVMIELPLLLAFRERAIQALIAGFVEEPVKQIGVAFVAFKSSIISSPRMGAIGGAFAGLGFGGIEAILFISFLSYAIPSHEAVTLRIPLVLFHIFLSAIAGAGVYFGASGGAVGKIKMVVLIALASTIHSLWNYVAFTAL